MSNKSAIDKIQLPQGGGAISGMGEKFSPDLFTGTGNFSVPIAVPPGRNGMQPSLGLGYSTGSGNSPFGLGWSLGVPGVMRQTAKGLPRYDDALDTFVLSGAEDLVPVPGGSSLTFGEPGFVQWYRPRTEGLFARIERHRDATNDYWKVWTKEGLVSYYGTPGAAGNDPATCRDPQDSTKLFGWKLSRTEDVFGNHILYEYERDLVNVDGPHLWEQAYLKTVKWNDFDHGGTQYLCKVEFVYGNRSDAFSEYHAGFEVRTVRRCEEIQIWHDPQFEPGYAGAIKVKTYRLTYLDERVAAHELGAGLLPLNGVSLLSRVQVIGHVGATEEAMPPLDFNYSQYEPLKRDFREIDGENLPPFSLAHPDYELVDLFGRGLPDIVQLNGVARYWRNTGEGSFAAPKHFRDAPVGVHLADPNVSLVDANGNGTADLLVQKAGMAGYYPMRFNGEWEERAFVKYKTVPTFSLNDPEVKLLDLDGDGVTDVLRNGSRFELYFNDRELGFHELKVQPRGTIADFPDVSFSDPRVRILNLCGGLPAIAMVHQGRIDYWPHFGRGEWGKRVTMKHSPRFPDRFNPAHVIFGDLDGDGYDDVVYVEHDQITVWINQSGNGFAEPFVIKGTPPMTDRDAVRIVDMLGNGVPGLLWSSGQGRMRMMFLDLAGGQKPYLLDEMKNNLGARTRVEYLPSTHYYHLDYRNLATRWITPLPFPVLCVARVEVHDEISKGKLTTEYSYHHGYWDGEEREFRGFGRVDQRDTEAFERYNSPGLLNTGAASQVEAVHFSPPTETRTWFHLGAIVKTTSTGNVSLLDQWTEADFSAEYWAGDANKLTRPAPMVAFLKNLPAKRRREALRTLRGSILRSELYALDGSAWQWRPYTVSENQTGVAQVVYLDDAGAFSYELSFDGSVAGAGGRVDLGKYWLFFPHGISSRSSAWERGDEPMTSVSFQGNYDNYGNALKSVSLAVPRTRCLDWMNANGSATESFLGTKSVGSLIHRDDATHYLIGRPLEAKSWEVVNDGRDSLWDIVADAMWTNLPDTALISHGINYYDGNAFAGASTLGDYGVLVRSLQLVLTDDILTAAYGATPPDYLLNTAAGTTWDSAYPAAFRSTVPDHAGYVPNPLAGQSGRYYVPTMKAKYDFHVSPTGARGLALESADPFGNISSVEYDDYDLLPTMTTDALGMQVAAVYDYRLMQPRLVTDPNGNRSAVRFSPLGFVVESGVMGKYGEAVGDWDSEGTYGPDFIASSLMEYDLFNYTVNGLPAYVRSTQREHHVNDSNVPNGLMNDALVQVAYSDGFGRVIQTRAQAEEVIFGDQDFGDSGLPALQGTNGNAVGVENTSTTIPNVIVNGFKTENNKGMVVEQWEPFYSTGWDYQAATRLGGQASGTLPSYYGQKVVMYYDSIGRAVRTLNPDGTEQRVLTGIPVALDVLTNFSPTPWESYTYDANDLAPLTHPSDTTVPSGHHHTPRSAKIDALGRMVESIDRNWDGTAVEEIVMRYAYDIRGNTLRVDDAIKNTPGSSRTASAFAHVYDLANQPLKTIHIDSGAGTVVFNAAGALVESRDAKGALALAAHDALMRPVHAWARDNASEPVTMRAYTVYGESKGSPAASNHLGRPWKAYDEAGLVEVVAYDFKGQPLNKVRNVLSDAFLLSNLLGGSNAGGGVGYNGYVPRVDWIPSGTGCSNESSLLGSSPQDYRTDINYDALGRPVEVLLPEDESSGRKVLTPTYNRGGAMESVELDGTTYVSRIAYNARGQRLLIAYGNGRMTRHAYDPVTMRQLRLRTEPFVLSGLTYSPSGGVEADNAYEYDLSGNITVIKDDVAGSGVGGGSAKLTRAFEYDALYRLLQATGREAGGYATSSTPWKDDFYIPDNSAGNTRAYTRQFKYDLLGNILQVAHNGGAGNTWNRSFNDFDTAPAGAYASGNTLTKVKFGSTTITSTHDDSGNVTAEGSSRHFEWDAADQLRFFWEGTSGGAPTQAAMYVYSGGERVKKVVWKPGGADAVVSTYIDGGFEHRYKVATGGSRSEAHNEVHVMDGRSRVAVLRVGTAFSGDSTPAVRYNLDDHLGNACFTLSDTGALISGEEYFPFGETAFGSHGKKRYRFCGKERDEESGLYYYGARYYAAWCCRFVSTDPLAEAYAAWSPYCYALDNPVMMNDPSGMAPEGGGGGEVESGGSGGVNDETSSYSADEISRMQSLPTLPAVKITATSLGPASLDNFASISDNLALTSMIHRNEFYAKKGVSSIYTAPPSVPPPPELIDDQGYLTYPVIALMKNAYGYNENSLIHSRYRAYENPDIDVYKQFIALQAGVDTGEKSAITLGEDVIYSSKNGQSLRFWFEIISHEEHHRNEVTNASGHNVGWYGEYIFHSLSYDYSQIPSEVEAYRFGMGDEIDYATMLMTFENGAAMKILRSSMAEQIKIRKLGDLGTRFYRQIFFPKEIKRFLELNAK